MLDEGKRTARRFGSVIRSIKNSGVNFGVCNIARLTRMLMDGIRWEDQRMQQPVIWQRP
ncbi:unnamed protein product [Gongylonema pulchrum]|uniref:Uncharacterized protein n=1 Tax=Gongylonema pulchrum TaxID=637853 RepID=A0A3P7RTL1_9BILA|nr:unnamed protein product [Gongylonema pulchrum]